MINIFANFKSNLKTLFTKKYFYISILISILASLFSLLIFIFLDHDLLAEILLLLSVFLFTIIAQIALILVLSREFNAEIKKIEKETGADEIFKLREQKSQEIAQLKANERFRKEFIGNVAHELKTPIFNIQGFVSTLLDGAINDSNVNVKYLERTEKNIQRLTTLVKDLDTISKLETGKLKPDMSVFDISELITDVFDILEVRSIEYSVRLSTNVQAGTMVYADKEKIMEVVHNLVLNSIIYGVKGGETWVYVWEQDNKIYVEVKDTGIGIAHENLLHIFERFYRVDKSRSRERGGSGLGLAIVKHIIDAHKQKITVESNLNEGSKFTFTLQKAN